MKTVIRRGVYVIIGVLVFLTAAIGFGAHWGFTTWGDLNVDEIIFQLQAPLQGTGDGMIGDYLIKGFLPALIVTCIYIVCMVKSGRRYRRNRFAACVLLLLIVSLFFIKSYIWNRLDVDEWLKGQNNTSLFIQENYVDPATVKITFPEKKRNLIYIYLESMETTYADAASGGAFPENVIPELTALAQEYEDFSGDEDQLNGGICFTGTTFTTGAMFAQTTGLPLKISIGGNNMDTQSSFFPNITGLGDILENEGYHQVLMIGSDATFGGRRLFFEQHGNYEIFDYSYAKQAGLIPEDYKVFWGFEDEKLFAFAKDELLKLAEEGNPFNLTMLTVDTHFEDGYVCRLCGTEFGDNQYANVFACSNRQVVDFVHWIQEQPFYKNTTVILCGDHTTMDKDFCENVDSSYQRKTYTAFINPAVEPVIRTKRTYSTLDMFPSTLGAIGVSIEDGRLGLGTDLFSDRQTLSEEYGYEAEAAELARKSLFLENMEKIDDNQSDKLLERHRRDMKNALTVERVSGEPRISMKVKNSFSSGLSIDHFDAVCTEENTGTTTRAELNLDPEGSGLYIGEADLSSWKSLKGTVQINVILRDGTVYENIVSKIIDFE